MTLLQLILIVIYGVILTLSIRWWIIREHGAEHLLYGSVLLIHIILILCLIIYGIGVAIGHSVDWIVNSKFLNQKL